MVTRTLSVPEVHCDHCKSSIEGALAGLQGVSGEVSLERKTVTVSWPEDSKVTVDEIRRVIEEQGYDVAD